MIRMFYSIFVNLFSEKQNNQNLYYWSIISNDGNLKTNCGFGWSDSETQAFSDGMDYYNKYIKNKDS